ncbi:MAG: hypothetical protein WH035_03850 [Spirochaetota bacterium]
MKRILLVIALILLIALPIFAQEVTVEDLNKRLTKLEMWKFGGLYINWMYVSIPNSGFQWNSFYVPTDGDGMKLSYILPRFTAQYKNGNFVAYFRLSAGKGDGTFPAVAWDRWYVQYNFGFMMLQVGKFTVGDTIQPEMFYTFWDSGANIKDWGSNGNNGFGIHIPVGPATIHLIIPSNLSWATGAEIINIHAYVNGTIADMLDFVVGMDYDMNVATAIWAGVNVAPIEILSIGANFAMNMPEGGTSAWELLWNVAVYPTEDIAIYHEGAYRAASQYLQAALCFYYTSIYVKAALEMDLTTSDMTIGAELGYDFAFGRLYFTPAFYLVLPPAPATADYGLKLLFLASF